MVQILEHLKALAKDEVGALAGPPPEPLAPQVRVSSWLGAGSFWRETFT